MNTYIFRTSALLFSFSFLSFISAMERDRFPSIKKIESENAQLPRGPYSQALLTSATQTLYISAQIPIHSKSWIMIMDIPQATAQVMEYLRAILEKSDMNFSNVVKSTI